MRRASDASARDTVHQLKDRLGKGSRQEGFHIGFFNRTVFGVKETPQMMVDIVEILVFFLI